MFKNLFRRQPKPQPTPFAELPLEAQTAAIDGVRSALRRIEQDIYEASNGARTALNNAEYHDGKAAEARKRHHDLAAEAHTLRQRHDALAATIEVTR